MSLMSMLSVVFAVSSMRIGDESRCAFVGGMLMGVSFSLLVECFGLCVVVLGLDAGRLSDEGGIVVDAFCF